MLRLFLFALLATLAGTSAASAQYTPEPLDPARELAAAPAGPHTPLPEQYLWTAGDITTQRPDRSHFPWNRPDLRAAPHLFRARFTLAAVPSAATLYLAGPRAAQVFLNGHLLARFNSNPGAPINFHVFHADARALLHPGENTLAIAAVRGRGVVTGAGPASTAQIAYGEVLAVKLLPARFGVEAAPLLLSTPEQFRSVATAPAGWEQPGFDDHAWPAAATLGPIEADPDLRQWNVDAGMYGWPGYRGLSSELRTLALPPIAVSHEYEGSGSLQFADPAGPLTLQLPPNLTDEDAPSLLLDFGREIAGRLLVESGSGTDATLSVAYGESELEALATGLTPEQRGGNYLGTNLLEVPANGIARGPKSAFRYVRITFLRGAPTLTLRSLRAESTYYPAAYVGSFHSSDPLLDRIWETGAYTAHLCMQDGLWDAPKRDRGRWVGDIDVEGRTLLSVFADPALEEDTLRRLAADTPARSYVNGISGYSALWVTSLETLYQHTGDLAFLQSQHAALLRILARMDQDVAPGGTLRVGKGWGFVDWAPGLYGTTENTRLGTQLQFLRGYQAAVLLLGALNDRENLARYDTRARTMLAASLLLRDSATRTVGTTWQLNSLAVLTHAAAISPNDSTDAPIWSGVLSRVKQDAPSDPVISPYFSAYLLDAMSALGHPEAALAWIRSYWGGMLAEGATSFWESYDLRWPKTDFHLSLEADGTSGFFVSLAHGWSSGPTAWIAENILGITPATPGFRTVSINPHLLGLAFAEGSVPTPHGPIHIHVDAEKHYTLDLPPGVEEAIPARHAGPGEVLLVDGKPEPSGVIKTPGHHTVAYASK